MIKIKILSEAKTINVTKPGLRRASDPVPQERYEYALTPQQRKAIVDNRNKLVDIVIGAMQTKVIDEKALAPVEAFFKKYQEDYATEDEGDYGDLTEMLNFGWNMQDFRDAKGISKKIDFLQRALVALQRAFAIIPLRCDDDEDEDCLGFSELGISPKQRKRDYEEMMAMQDFTGVDFTTGEELPPKKSVATRVAKPKQLKGKL